MVLLDQKMLLGVMRFITKANKGIMRHWVARIIKQVKHFIFTDHELLIMLEIGFGEN